MRCCDCDGFCEAWEIFRKKYCVEWLRRGRRCGGEERRVGLPRRASLEWLFDNLRLADSCGLGRGGNRMLPTGDGAALGALVRRGAHVVIAFCAVAGAFAADAAVFSEQPE